MLLFVKGKQKKEREISLQLDRKGKKKVREGRLQMCCLMMQMWEVHMDLSLESEHHGSKSKNQKPNLEDPN